MNLVVIVPKELILLLVERFEKLCVVVKERCVLICRDQTDPVLMLPSALITDLYILRQLLMFYFLNRHAQCQYAVRTGDQTSIPACLLLKRLQPFYLHFLRTG